ncbi:hypothetical protein TIFTF001_014466 [Ficus carica]|uniref:Uncharacterized protein n=1 Tax=Ficus carica TaxID=3494 RepID=A0AA88A3T3_FICCA|nr:hypothetical protein TIFTF001_014466 [Ficus carica]
MPPIVAAKEFEEKDREMEEREREGRERNEIANIYRGHCDVIRVVDVGEDSQRLEMVMTSNERHMPELQEGDGYGTTMMRRKVLSKHCDGDGMARLRVVGLHHNLES